MVRGDELAFFGGGGDEGAPGQVIGPAEESAGSLVDGRNGLFGEERLFDAGDFQVVVEVEFHLLAVDPFQMGSGYHSGRKGQRGAVEQFIQEVVLAGEDDG